MLLKNIIPANTYYRAQNVIDTEKKKHIFLLEIRFRLIKHEICKNAFYGTHGITEHRVDYLASSLKIEISAPLDIRGKHINRHNKMPEEILHNIENPINPRSSHYSRGKNDHKFFCLHN